jgi:hypothetical protein
LQEEREGLEPYFLPLFIDPPACIMSSFSNIIMVAKLKPSSGPYGSFEYLADPKS